MKVRFDGGACENGTCVAGGDIEALCLRRVGVPTELSTFVPKDDS